MAAYYWCRTCGRFSSLAEVARFGVGVYPYMCPSCVVVDEDGKFGVPPGRGELRPWPRCAHENSNLPEAPTVGAVYPPPSAVAE
jgi:hypothetical protein